MPPTSSTNRSTNSTNNSNNANSNATSFTRPYSYDDDFRRLEIFFRHFSKDLEGERRYIYMDILTDLANRTKREINLQLDDVLHFDPTWEDLVLKIERNTMRFHSLCMNVIDTLIPAPTNPLESEDVFDILRLHRQDMLARQPAPLQLDDEAIAPAAEPIPFPKELQRRYELHILPRSNKGINPIREVKASLIGSLVTVRGIVTRISEVKPMIVVATYSCLACGHEIYQEITSRSYSPVDRCQSDECKQRGGQVKGGLIPQTRGSKFVKYQEIRIQELADQVPIGHIPRLMTVQLRGELTRTCTPGDIITVDGVFLPTPHVSNRFKRSNGIITDTYLEAMNVCKMKKTYHTYSITEALKEKVTVMAEQGDAYAQLARSLAPEIYGHVDVKKALLLLMTGGITRHLADGMKIRGDINMCLMGDPGVAKSQLLKHLATIAPRGIYTSGKGASGVGLTAAVLRDPVTGDMLLEGGSLVLADKGICCIDEFDKMDDSDRTAIHEVMEQQTISIAKAGITTTLNARCSILAAANPAFGRYNPKKSPAENINLPAALLSRFDLMYLMLDIPDMDDDRALAEHVTFVHRNGHHPALETQVLEPEFIRTYISQARQIDPLVPKELSDYIVMAYTNIRREESRSPQQFTYTTARTLLAILRLSTALARIRFDPEVCQADVDEAMRLMHMCKSSLLRDRGGKNSGQDPISAIYDIIRNAQNKDGKVRITETVTPRVLAKGYTARQLDECLRMYEELSVWTVSAQRNEITFVQKGQ